MKEKSVANKIFLNTIWADVGKSATACASAMVGLSPAWKLFVTMTL